MKASALNLPAKKLLFSHIFQINGWKIKNEVWKHIDVMWVVRTLYSRQEYSNGFEMSLKVSSPQTHLESTEHLEKG